MKTFLILIDEKLFSGNPTISDDLYIQKIVNFVMAGRTCQRDARQCFMLINDSNLISYKSEFQISAVKLRTRQCNSKWQDLCLAIRQQELNYPRSSSRTLVLITGNKDYLPAVRSARKHGWRVEVWFWCRAISKDLQKAATSAYFLKSEFRKQNKKIRSR